MENFLPYIPNTLLSFIRCENEEQEQEQDDPDENQAVDYESQYTGRSSGIERWKEKYTLIIPPLNCINEQT